MAQSFDFDFSLINGQRFSAPYASLNSMNNVSSNETQKVDLDESIFALGSEENTQLLEEQLVSVQEKQGAMMSAWDDFKGFVGIGTSSEKCDDAIMQYKMGQISYEEALAEIEKFNSKQDSSLDLFSNIATGVAAIVAGTAVGASGGTLAPVFAGAIAGAVTKSGVKTADRATNEVEGDALNAKQITKDALTGAISGAIGVKTAGTAGNPFKNGFKVGSTKLISGGTAACVAKCAMTGAQTGAISGATNYSIDCAFEEDKDFNLKDFAVTTATNSAYSATVGAIMGGFNGTLRTNGMLEAGGDVITHNTVNDIVANSVCTTEYKLVNNAIRSVAA